MNSTCTNKDDMENLIAVKELLEEDVLTKFTLRELEYQVGLNEFKLKRDLKSYSGKRCLHTSMI